MLPDEADADGDGFITGTIDPSGWAGPNSVQEGDCDDSEAARFPGAAALDDPNMCLLDADGDGYADPLLNNGFEVIATTAMARRTQ